MQPVLLRLGRLPLALPVAPMVRKHPGRSRSPLEEALVRLVQVLLDPKPLRLDTAQPVVVICL